MIPRWQVLFVSLVLAGGCASTPAQKPTTPKPKSPPAAVKNPAAPDTAKPAESAASTDESHQAPELFAIGALKVSADKRVRVRGYVKQGIWLRLVPRRTVFMLGDRSGTVMALIKGKVQIELGLRLDAVGHYREIPSPVYTGPSTPPPKKVLIIERFLKL